MKYCLKCAEELPDDAKFCSKCGAKQAPDEKKKETPAGPKPKAEAKTVGEPAAKKAAVKSIAEVLRRSCGLVKDEINELYHRETRNER